ncbi:hypothetical protein ACRDNQ_17360 [Palleronia sp. KMU-117]|uniref:hypothetical protein n=1 Tax=Palleronia sp. KMU-117 TaxID=3434108 RepID=UPI003D734B15
MNGIDPDRLADHRRSEAVAGWPLLRSCPNTLAVKAIRYLDRLTPDQAARLGDDWTAFEAELAAAKEPLSDLRPVIERYPALATYNADRASLGDRRGVATLPVKVIAGVRRDPSFETFEKLASSLRWPEGALRLHPPVVSELDGIVPAPPRRIRKEIAHTLKQRFGASEERSSSDMSRFVGSHGGRPVAVDVLFAGGGAMSMHQLGYWVWVRGADGKTTRVAGYESIWMLPAQWDYVTEENLGRSCALLADLTEVIDDLYAR